MSTLKHVILSNFYSIKVITIFLFILFSHSIYAEKTRSAYCEVIVWSHHIMFNAAVTFDFGMQTHTTVMLYDSKNLPLRFITGMDAVNFLSKRGWRLVSTYYESINESESAHYVMEKTITDEKQVKEGLVMRQIKMEDFFKMLQIPDFKPNE